MLNQWRNIFVILILCVCLNPIVFAANTAVPDKTLLVSQQIELLKNRLVQAQNELKLQQKQQKAQLTGIDQRALNQIMLDIAVARSNLDSVNIELFESQQAVNRLQKEIQEIQNQLNVYTVFGLKVARDGAPDVNRLQMTLSYLKDLLQLDQARVNYLQKLQAITNNTLQLYRARYARIESWLKSRTILQLREQQAKSELALQQQQSSLLQHLNLLNAKLNQLQSHKNFDRQVYDQLQNEIFNVNENINFTYQQMLIARYQEQIQQLRISITNNTSITLLNQATEQARELGRQLTEMTSLLNNRLAILAKRKNFFAVAGEAPANYKAEFSRLTNQYQTAITTVSDLSETLVSLRSSLDKALQRELSARQGLPGFGTQAWIDLGGEILLVPALTFQVVKNLGYEIVKAFGGMTIWDGILFSMLLLTWWMIFGALYYLLKRVVTNMPDHELGHINLKWLSIKLLQRNSLDLALLGNLIWLFSLCGIPTQTYSFLLNLAVVWLVFKSIIMTARLGLVETVHHRDGHDVRLYHKLRWMFLAGGIVTGLTVFIYQLPVIYEVKDLFDRVFLLFLLVASVFLLRQWNLVPGLILPHIDERRMYLRRVVVMLGLLVPLVLLVNSVIGLLGFVNLIFTIAWYEGVFLLVLAGYLAIRGLLSDAMEWVSKLLIRHVTNGWLWTEAFLKPIDRVLRVILFLSAWFVLFVWYGWDQQSPVVERLGKLLSYHLLDVLNTAITLRSIIGLVVTISLFYWAARWTREFVYRLLLSRTKDLGLRNSLAILSQYAVIVVGSFICLRMLGIDYRSLTFAVTAFSFGVGLGLRDLANNFASGFLLLIERPMRVGDLVSISGYEGEVMHIGGRAVTIQTWDHMEVLVPNAEIFSKTFLNWTAKDNIIRAMFTLKINRHDSPHDVQAVIYQVLFSHKEVLTDPAPEVFLKELADGLTEFEVRYFINVRQVKSRIGLRSEILLAIWEAFERHGIQPPFPRHEILLKSADVPAVLSQALSD